MPLSRHAFFIILVVSLSAAIPAVASGPGITPQILQCDGTYASGSSTNHPNPKVRASISDAGGIRIGTVKMGTPSGTKALWRFSGGESFSAGACMETAWDFYGIPTAWAKTYTYSYQESENTSSPIVLGHCTYTSVNTCASYTGVSGSPVPVGLAACPGTPPSGSIAGAVLTAAGNGSNFANAASFNGVQFGSITYNVTIGDPPPTYTMSAWIYPTNVTGKKRLISQESATGKWVFGLNGTGVNHYDSRDASSPDTAEAARGSAVTINAWHQIHLVRDNTFNTRKFYVDGNLVGTAVAVSSDSFYPNHPIGSNIYVGATSAGAEGFSGRIDELRILHNVVLSDEDIKLEYLGSYHRRSTNSGSSYVDEVGMMVPSVNGSVSTVDTPPTTETTASRFIFKAQNINTASTVLGTYLFTIDTSKPTAPGLSGTPGTDFITWAWTAPAKLCSGPGLPAVTYDLIDARTGTHILDNATTPLGESVVGANTSAARVVQVTDNWGTSPLSAAVTTYTLAYVPTTLAPTNISTGGASISWNANTNPAYTRYELTYSPDDFTATTSTRAAFSADFTGTSTNINGLATGTTYYLRVRAFNGRSSDFSGGTPTAFLTGSFVTLPAAPALTGTALSMTSLKWDWTHPSGASGYNLYDKNTSALIYTGDLLTYTSSTLTINTRYDAEVEAFAPAPSGAGVRASSHVYTWAAPPSGQSIWRMYSSSGVFVWNANGNPSYTNYELSISTDSAFHVIVATIGVLGTTATVTELLPGTSYFARVRAFNGDQIPAPAAGFILFAATMTASDPRITVSSAPPSPYVAPVGLAGSWQFDEGSGLTTADGSGNGNPALLTCTSALCTSTPTFVAGPSGLGTAASFSGLEYGVARTQSSFAAFNDDLTVEAWVYPQSVSQRDYAGLVAIGNKDTEDFALDIVSNRFRFLANSVPSVKAAWSPSTITPGAWTHVVGVYDSGAGTAALYLNGTAVASVASVPARTNSGQKLSIGNRPDSAGLDKLPFYGRLDAVRVIHRALSAAEVLSDYRGGFVSTVTPSSPNNGVLVALPPNAFSVPVQIYVSADPVSHPIRIPPATLSAGLSALPSGLTLVPNSIVEVVPIVGGVAYAGTLGSSATVTIPYTDSDGNNLVDGTVLAATGIKMFTLNTTVNRWEELSTSVDPSNHRASGLTPHFSVFALFAPTTVGSGLSGVRVYPVPWKPGSGGSFDSSGLVFDNLPAAGSIRILTLAGENIADLHFDGHDAGSLSWDGKTKHGRLCASGVYFAKITSAAGGSMFVKFAVER